MKRDKMSECWQCKNEREVPGDTHIRCAKPDPEMRGNAHGIKHGWFFYPLNFDPCWKEVLCNNFEPKSNASAVSNAVSGAVSDVSPTA